MKRIVVLLMSFVFIVPETTFAQTGLLTKISQICGSLNGSKIEASYSIPGWFGSTVTRRKSIKFESDGTLTIDPAWIYENKEVQGYRFNNNPVAPTLGYLEHGQTGSCSVSQSARDNCLLHVKDEIDDLQKFQSDPRGHLTDAQKTRVCWAINWLQDFQRQLSKPAGARQSYEDTGASTAEKSHE